MHEEPSRVTVHTIVFPGTDQERQDLFAAVNRNCACGPGSGAEGVDLCAPHELLLLEPTLKRLVFHRRWHRGLRNADEFGSSD